MFKRILFFLVLLIIPNLLIAQKGIDHFEDYKCSRFKGENRLFFKSSQNQHLNNYDLKFYKLDIEVTNTSTYIEGYVLIKAEVQNTSLDTFVIEFASGMTVGSVLINEINHSFTHSENEIYVSLSYSLDVGNIFTVQIFYSGVSQSEGFSGVSNDADNTWGNQVTWSLSEPFSALEWFPCKQVLEDKADSVHVFLTTSSDLMVGSNGILTAVTSLPANKVRYEWKSNYPIAYYLISFSVADYQEYNIYARPEGLEDSILIQNFIYNNYDILSIMKDDIDETKDLIELFSELYTIYPFYNEKYGHCLIPWGGGMEHQTMTSLGNFGFGLVAHELGHQWFGDNVTCATWQDIWINEGFASYTEYLALQCLYSQSSADFWMENAHSWALSKPKGSIYIPEEEINDVSRIFSGALSYKKGAAIIHMIRFELQNDSLFFLTLKNFQEQFKDSVATGMDFKRVLEVTSGMDFTDFFDQWYFGEGYPIFDISWKQENDTLILTSFQTTSSTVTRLFKMLMEYKLNYTGGDTTIQVYQTQNSQTFKVYFPFSLNSINVDPDNWVLNEVANITSSQDEIPSDEVYFLVYPNPFFDVINIKFLNDNVEREIYLTDIVGRVILKYKTKQPGFSINGNHLNSGVYLIYVNDGRNSYVRRVIKQ